MEHLAKVLREEYNLSMQHAERIDFGIWEECFRVETSEGRLFAKRFRRRERLTENLLRGLRLSNHLRPLGVPSPPVRPTRSGELIAQVDGERYHVNEWVSGITYRPGDLPVREARAMGALLGRFHRLTGSAGTAPANGSPSPGTAAERCSRLLERYRERSEPFAQVAQEVLAQQIALLAELPADFAESLPRPRLSGTCFSWFERPYRRMDDWERTAERWHRLVPQRFAERSAWTEAILGGPGR